MTERDEPTRVDKLLDRVGRRLGVEDAVASGKLWSSWSSIVGDAVAAHARPTSLRDGLLRVCASSPVWATEIGYLAARIRSQVNAALGAGLVKEVRVYTGNCGSDPDDRVVEGRPVPPVATVAKPAETDPRQALERAHAAWSERRARGRGGRHSP